MRSTAPSVQTYGYLTNLCREPDMMFGGIVKEVKGVVVKITISAERK